MSDQDEHQGFEDAARTEFGLRRRAKAAPDAQSQDAFEAQARWRLGLGPKPQTQTQTQDGE